MAKTVITDANSGRLFIELRQAEHERSHMAPSAEAFITVRPPHPMPAKRVIGLVATLEPLSSPKSLPAHGRSMTHATTTAASFAAISSQAN